MKPGLLTFSFLLSLAVALAASPALAMPAGGNSGQDRLEEMKENGWIPVAPGVLQRSQGDYRVETFAVGPEGFAWRVRQLRTQLAILVDEYRVRPNANLRKAIRSLRQEIRKTQGSLTTLESAAAKTGCNFSHSTYADAYPAEPANGVKTNADAHFNNDCGSSGDTYAYAYATASLNGTITTLTQTDSDSGSTIASYATASVAGTADCYSYGYASVIDGGTFYSAVDESFVCAPALPPVFADVPLGYWARRYIEAIYFAGITAGCAANPRAYCPDGYVNRAQAPIALITAKGPAGYVPPPCTTAIFGDVPCTYWAAPWINEFARRGITVGCGGGNYCPEPIVDRGTMAYFLLATLGVPAPTTCTGMFSDVPCNVWYAPWVEELARRGFTVGDGGGQYYPTAPVDRAQMAVFLVRTFNVPMP